MRSCAIPVHKHSVEAMLLQQCREVTTVILSITPWLPTYMGQSLIRCNRVPTVVGIEGSHASRRGYRVVVSLLGHWEQVHPIVLFLVDVWPEARFDNLVDSFGLSVRLWVESRGHLRANTCD